MTSTAVRTHQLDGIRTAVEEGRRGGLRLVACCGCGWRSRATLTRGFAHQEWAVHVEVATHPAA